MNIDLLKERQRKCKKNIIDMIYLGRAGHPGGSLSCIDILNYLYTEKIKLNELKRSRVILSKGHVTPAIYSVFLELGIIKEEELKGFRQVNSRLQGHPDRNKIKELDANTGLLGQGLSIGVGMALAKKYNQEKNYVYVIVGDGEMHEGQIWEALMSGAHYKLNNLIVFLDYNKLSSKGNVNKVMNLEKIKEKIKAFNWNVCEINGHDFIEIDTAVKLAESQNENPTFIIANTIKGNGISFMENNPKWHSGTFNEEQYKIAISEIESR